LLNNTFERQSKYKQNGVENMLVQLNNIMKQANASKMVITLTSFEGQQANAIIATQFKTLDDSNALQQALLGGVAAQGYIGSLEAELADKLAQFEPQLDSTSDTTQNSVSESETFDSL
jgi:hypothetical protein